MANTKDVSPIGSSVLDHIREIDAKKPGYAAQVFADAEKLALAHALKEARKKRNLTQAQLAKKIRTTQSVVARLESGSSTPQLTMLNRIGKALGFRVRVIFEDARA